MLIDFLLGNISGTIKRMYALQYTKLYCIDIIYIDI